MIVDPNAITSYTDRFIAILIDYSPKIISAFLILFIGFYAIRFTHKVIRKILAQNHLDPTLTKFLADLVLWGLRGLLFITVISKLGIETTSFVAILGAMGLAIGMSLQGSLSNFAGGVLIILFKPFKVGDSIEAQGILGTVKEIQIFVTKLITSSNQTVFIPNGALSNGTIINYSMQGYRRLDLTVGIANDTDLKKAKELITGVLKNNSKVRQNFPLEVTVKSLAGNSIQLSVKPWANNEDLDSVISDTLENLQSAFEVAEIPLQSYAAEGFKK